MAELPVPTEKWMAEQLLHIERRLSELEGARDGGATTIAQGALTVVDAAGVVRTRLGLLSDGDYGIEVNDAAGVPISVGGSLFGLQAVSQWSHVVVSSVSSVPTDLGLDLDVKVGPTGRLIVILTAELSAVTTVAEPNTAAIVVAVLVDGVQAMSTEMRFLSDVATQGVQPSPAAVAQVLDLAPGVRSLRVEGVRNVVPCGTIMVDNRSLIALPL